MNVDSNVKSEEYQLTLHFVLHMSAAVNMCVTRAPFNMRTVLLITRDFSQTIKTSKSALRSQETSFRAVQWVLSSPNSGPTGGLVFMVISPYETNEMLHEIGKSKTGTLHFSARRMDRRNPRLDALGLLTTRPRRYLVFPL